MAKPEGARPGETWKEYMERIDRYYQENSPLHIVNKTKPVEPDKEETDE